MCAHCVPYSIYNDVGLPSLSFKRQSKQSGNTLCMSELNSSANFQIHRREPLRISSFVYSTLVTTHAFVSGCHSSIL